MTGIRDKFDKNGSDKDVGKAKDRIRLDIRLKKGLARIENADKRQGKG